MKLCSESAAAAPLRMPFLPSGPLLPARGHDFDGVTATLARVLGVEYHDKPDRGNPVGQPSTAAQAAVSLLLMLGTKPAGFCAIDLAL